MEQGEQVSLSILNPVLLAIKYRSVQCLRYLLDTFGVRTSIKPAHILIHSEGSEFKFSQWLLPIMVRVKDLEVLATVLKQPGIWMQARDL